MATPRTRYARSGDVHLAYQVIGDGPRDIVLVLDWASHLEAVWEQGFVQEFISSLTRFARVLWFDMRGIGLSDRVAEETVAAEDWMEDVGAVMDAAGSERATILAHGHAAQMALLFAATHPDRLESLVLLHGFARLSRAGAYPWPLPDPDLLGAIEEFVTGSRSADEDADRVLATVLFVDVAGSTERVSELGDRRWKALLERFEETVQQALDAHRGELKNRAGDGVLATFDGPARAIRCAWQIRDSVRQSGLDVHCGR